MPSSSYRHQAPAHVGVGHGEAGLVDGLLKDQVDDSLQPLLRVHRQVCHLLHQLVEHLGRQLVQDASYLAEQLLEDTNTAQSDTSGAGGFQEWAGMLPTGEWRHPVGTSGKLSDTPQPNPSSHLATKDQGYRAGVLETPKCFCQV